MPQTTGPERLLKRLYRFRERAKRRGIARLFARQRRAALCAELARDWPGAYAFTDQGDLAFVPAPLDAQGERVLFYGFPDPVAALAFVPQGGVAIDVGANLGEWSVPLAKAVGSEGQVLCCEPNPMIADALSATLRINNLTHARVIAAALSSCDGEGHLQVDTGNTGLSRMSASTAGIAITLRRLDSIVADHTLERLDFLKIDVEGHERQVIEGAAATLSRFEPALVFESGHETTADRLAIQRMLGELGYDIVAVLHDYGALACTDEHYAAASGACAGPVSCNVLALSRRTALKEGSRR